MDSWTWETSLIWHNDGMVVWFTRSEMGLLFYDTNNNNKINLCHKHIDLSTQCSFFQKAAKNETGCRQREIKGIQAALDVSRSLLYLMQSHVCRVKKYLRTFHPGRSPRQLSTHIVDVKPMAIPWFLHDECKNNISCMDFFHVIKMPVFLSIIQKNNQ